MLVCCLSSGLCPSQQTTRRQIDNPEVTEAKSKESSFVHLAVCNSRMQHKMSSLHCSPLSPRLYGRACAKFLPVRVRRSSRHVQCGLLTEEHWDGTDPVPNKLCSRSVSVCRPSKSIDGLTLYQLCQSRPHLKELKVSAASFNSPMQGQWDMRNLTKLHVEFEQPDHDIVFEQFLQHADNLYLQELKLTYTGPGFASLNAASLAKLHVKQLQLEGFTIRQSTKLAHHTGQLNDCVLDVSWLDLAIFYHYSAQYLKLNRCRLSKDLSWRFWAPLGAAVGSTALGYIFNPGVTAAVFCSFLLVGAMAYLITSLQGLALRS